MKLRDLGEFAFLRRLRPRLSADSRVLLGVGDDCAAVALPDITLLTTDTLIEGVHFRCEWASFATLGEKAFVVNASDIAAMGGEPAFALLNLGVPHHCEVENLDAFFDGFLGAAHADGATLIGGNLSAAPCLMVSVTVLGRTAHSIVTRSGAHLGDDIYITGTVGDAGLGLRLLQEGRDGVQEKVLIKRFLRPPARVKVGRELAIRCIASAMIDVSDGLLQDLGHVCQESQIGAVIEAATLPLSAAYRALLGAEDWRLALTGGEDYELLFCAPVSTRPAVEALARSLDCPITRIGTIVPREEGICIRGPKGLLEMPTLAGHDHFRQASS